MNTTKMRWAIMAGACCFSVIASADILLPNDTDMNPPPADLEASLYEIYNDRYNTNFTTNADMNSLQIDDPGLFSPSLAPEGFTAQPIANWAFMTQNFGYYTTDETTGDITFTELFGDLNNTQTNPGAVVEFNPGEDFGFYNAAHLPESFYAPGEFPGYENGQFGPGAIGHTWYSQMSLHDANYGVVPTEDHMLFYATADPNVFLLAWEDLPFEHPESGFDFNDLVVEIRLNPIIPEPTSMALFGIGIAGFAAHRNWRRKRA
jgi:hypothetical protein